MWIVVKAVHNVFLYIYLTKLIRSLCYESVLFSLIFNGGLLALTLNWICSWSDDVAVSTVASHGGVDRLGFDSLPMRLGSP